MRKSIDSKDITAVKAESENTMCKNNSNNNVHFVSARRNGEHVTLSLLIGDSLERFSCPVGALGDPALWYKAAAALRALVEARNVPYLPEHGAALFKATEAACTPALSDEDRRAIEILRRAPEFTLAVETYDEGQWWVAPMRYLSQVGLVENNGKLFTLRPEWR